MPPKKYGAKTNRIDDASTSHSIQHLSESTQCSQRSRAKKYTKEETDMLVKICADFHGIINKNSNSTADIKQKTKAWQHIKRTFDKRCKSEAIFVSFFHMWIKP